MSLCVFYETIPVTELPCSMYMYPHALDVSISCIKLLFGKTWKFETSML